MLNLVATGNDINHHEIQIGDSVSGYCMGKFPFTGKIVSNRSNQIRQNGRYHNLIKFSILLTSDCERPQNGLFKSGETILITLNGNKATELITLSR